MQGIKKRLSVICRHPPPSSRSGELNHHASAVLQRGAPITTALGAAAGRKGEYRSGSLELAVEVAAHPAVEKNNDRHGGGRCAESEGGRFPSVVQLVIQKDHEHGKDANQADKTAQRHEVLPAEVALALAG